MTTTLAATDADIRVKTEETIKAFLKEERPFTPTCVSNEVKEAIWDSHGTRVGHFKHVKPVIDELRADGIFEDADFVSSTITVYPPDKDGNDGKPMNVRLFHHHSYDPDNFTDIRTPMWNPPPPDLAKGGWIDITGDDGDDGDDSAPTLIIKTADGKQVSGQCEVQRKNNALNIPSMLIHKAGWAPGDTYETCSSGNSLMIRLDTSGGNNKQKVDKEGRIRLYGSQLKVLQNPITALLIDDGVLSYKIRLQ